MNDHYIISENWGCQVTGYLEDLEKELKYKRLQYPKDRIKVKIYDERSIEASERLKKAGAESQAMEAWERLCCRGGVGLELTDRAKATIQAMGGWEANGKGLESDGKWWRKQFSELYCGMSEGKKQELLENSGAKRISDRSGGAVSAFDIKELPFADWGEE